jgi:hypothetical protein
MGIVVGGEGTLTVIRHARLTDMATSNEDMRKASLAERVSRFCARTKYSTLTPSASRIGSQKKMNVRRYECFPDIFPGEGGVALGHVSLTEENMQREKG